MCLACVCGVIGRDTVYGHETTISGTLLVFISMVCFIFAVIMQVNIPICDIFDICYDYPDVHHNIYTAT